MTAAIIFFFQSGSTLYYGDAESHLNIARRTIDSRTPGWVQIGSAWLPLPHLLMMCLVWNDWLWRTALAGAITSGVCTVIAATFLFAAVRRLFESTAAAATAATVFLLNPNTLYLGSIPMSEGVWFACLFGLLYFTIRFRQEPGWGALIGAGLCGFAGTLTRYEGWFILPFAAIFVWLSAAGGRWAAILVFSVIAGAGPLLWFWHNWWYFEDPLYFYRGPYSALAIQGGKAYPGLGDWRVAAEYFFAAARLVGGRPALYLTAVGVPFAIEKRGLWPVILLLLPSLFYIWSIHSSGNPIHVPNLWPYSWYNTRYALAVLPLAALATAALARFARPLGVVLVLTALFPFLMHPLERCITWQESDMNSRARRAWTAEAVEYLAGNAHPHDTFLTSFSDVTAIYRTLGIPLRATLSGDNEPEWMAAEARPDLFLHEDWAVAIGGDAVESVVDKARLQGVRYELAKRIAVKDAPVVDIYRRFYASPVR